MSSNKTTPPLRGTPPLEGWQAKPDGVVMPKLRFPEFRGMGEWEEKPLGDFLTESRIPGSKGDVAKKLTVKLWGNGVFAKNETIQGSVNTQYFRRKSGQFIYSKLDFLNQAFGVIPAALDNYESTVDLPCFDFSEGIDSGFLLEYVKRKDFYEKNGEEADGSRKAKRIQVEAFLSFPILIPELVEQQKIASCLASIDELITLEAQKLDTLKTHKKGLMQQLFPAEGETLPRLRFPEFRDDGEWEEKQLSEIAIIRSGTTPLRSNPEFYEGGNIPWVKTTDLNNSFIYKTEECITNKANAKINPAGSILVAMYGGFNQIGRTGYLMIPAATNQALSVLNVENDKLIPIFLLTWLNAKVETWKKIAGSSRKDPNITGSDVARFTIKYPCIQEQQKIASCLASLDNLITTQTQKLAALKTHKKGLMQQLFPQTPTESTP